AKSGRQNEPKNWLLEVKFEDGRNEIERLIARLVDYQGGVSSQQVDLYRFDLTADSGAFGTCTFLAGANLQRTSWEGAVLAHSFFPKSDFSRANLKHAMLDDSDLGGAILRDADLTGASLDKCVLRGA